MSNHLASEKSPYLRQHADNPVEWWPWSADALAAARDQDKPILLSIGYSACHWCHVMAHESFEDAATAQLMNALFVCIKVDREERPDLDKIYQLAHQALTQRGGGWPLTVFLGADDLTPFYAGTYFPKEARYGMPPFSHVLRQVRGYWDQRRAEVRSQNALLREFLEGYGRAENNAAALTDMPLRAALAQIAQNFDRVHGGHVGAPKFPHCAEMELLLDLACLSRRVSGDATSGETNATDTHPRAAISAATNVKEVLADEVLDPNGAANSPQSDAARSMRRIALPGVENAEAMVALTLQRIADGGIHDQIGGGFCRYSVDERWEIPHFEKMLYDNAQLLPLYSLRRDDADAARAARGLVEWLQREMTAPAGGFYAALDADSEHEEGKFYVWQREAVRELLDADEFAVAERRWGFDRPANFEHAAWNPVVASSVAEIAAALALPAEEVEALIEHARAKLFAERSKRVRPGLDDKILTAWNALMIGGLARASRAGAHAPEDGDIRDGRIFDSTARASASKLARSALEYLRASVWREGRLFAKAGDDSARFPAYLDDYAFLLDALVEFLQCEWNSDHFAWAIALAEALLERFEDREDGGFWFTAHDHEALIQRPKPFADDATPSGNGIAARALLRLGHLTAEPRYLDAAARTLRAGWATMQQMPQACASLQRALGDFLYPRTHVVVRFADAAEGRAWRDATRAAVDRRTDVYFIAHDAMGLPATIAAQKHAAGGTAYLCRGAQCGPPIGMPQELVEQLVSLP